MLRLSEIYLMDDMRDKLMMKWEIYRAKHPEDNISIQEFAKMLMEYGIQYLDISALD